MAARRSGRGLGVEGVPVRPHVFLGLDVGGSSIKVALVELGLRVRVLFSASLETPGNGSRDALVETLAHAVLPHKECISAVGVALPGWVDPCNGATRSLPNIRGDWRRFRLGAELTERVQKPTRIINDGNAFTLAEARAGVAVGARSILGIVIGTGVGGGLVLKGRLHLGAAYAAGEIGHIVVVAGGARCVCGKRGCLETIASARAIAAAAGTSDGVAAGEAARNGEKQAIAAFERAADSLALAIENANAILALNIVVIGGGMISGNDNLVQMVRARLPANHMVSPTPAVRVASLGAYAGAVGAAFSAEKL